MAANIYQRINKVMQACEYVQKEEAQQGKGVKYDTVVPMIRDLLIENGIVMVVRQPEMSEGAPVEGTKQKVYTGLYEMDLVNMDDPNDKVTHSTYAQGMDGGDKAAGKAHTYAVKTMLVKGFLIETGEDEEARPDNAGNTKEEKAYFQELLENEAALPFYAFIRQIGPERYTSLYNSFKTGEKMSGKKLCDKLADKGLEIAQNYADEIEDYSAIEDPALFELTDELAGMEKTVVWELLSAEVKEVVKKMSKERVQ